MTDEEREAVRKHEEYLDSLPEEVKKRLEIARKRDASGDGDNIILLHGLEKGMVGTTVNDYGITIAVYERSRSIDHLAEDFDKDNPERNEDECRTDAIEWFDYNTVRAIPYMGESAPMIIEAFDDGDREYKIDEEMVEKVPGLPEGGIVAMTENSECEPVPVYESDRCVELLKSQVEGGSEELAKDRMRELVKEYEDDQVRKFKDAHPELTDAQVAEQAVVKHPIFIQLFPDMVADMFGDAKSGE